MQFSLPKWPRLAIEVKGIPEPRAAFIAASPNEIEAARNMPLAGEGRSFLKKAYLEPVGLMDEETAILYLVPRVLKRAQRRKRLRPGGPGS